MRTPVDFSWNPLHTWVCQAWSRPGIFLLRSETKWPPWQVQVEGHSYDIMAAIKAFIWLQRNVKPERLKHFKDLYIVILILFTSLSKKRNQYQTHTLCNKLIERQNHCLCWYFINILQILSKWWGFKNEGLQCLTLKWKWHLFENEPIGKTPIRPYQIILIIIRLITRSDHHPQPPLHAEYIDMVLPL